MAAQWEELFARWQERAFQPAAIAEDTDASGIRDALLRWLEWATPEQRAEVTHALAKRIAKDWTAAIALALIGDRAHTSEILAAMKRSRELKFEGYAVAIETLRDPSAVPALMAMLEERDPKRTWSLERALQCCAGRAPLIEQYRAPEQHATAAVAAWKRPALDRPTLCDIQCARRSASFSIDHGGGELRLRYTPYNGGSWPRWNRALYVNDTLLYDVSSGCETCRSILQLSGELDDATSLDRYRAALTAIDAITDDTLHALHPLLARLQTGHYLATLADIAVERVTDPARSWLVRDVASNRAPSEDELDYAPRVAHFQSLRRDLHEGTHMSAVLVPSQNLARLDEEQTRAYERAIRGGERPAVIALTWVEDRFPASEGKSTVRTVLGMILDGHHKMAAYARVGAPARILAITSINESTAGRSDEAARAAGEAFAVLSAA